MNTIKNLFYRIMGYSRLQTKRILIFGDSNASYKIVPDESPFSFFLENHPILALHNPNFDKLLSTSIKKTKPDYIILFAGSNDVGLGYYNDEIEEKIKGIKKKYGDFILLSHHFSEHVPSINLVNLPTIDGIHLTDDAYKTIKKELEQLLSIYCMT